jgi:hypothetical protein
VDRPFVSVIIPTCDRRELVKRAVASVLTQTMPSFEVIVVDDGSTDGTREALADLDERLRYRWQPNRGAPSARNTGVRLARGEIVAFLDSDDVWLPDHLETLVGALERHPAAILASTCPGSLLAGRQKPMRARLVDPLAETFMHHSLPGFTSCVAARREALVTAGGFDERLKVGDDPDMWLRLGLRGPFALVRRRTVVKHRTPGSLFESQRGAPGLRDHELRIRSEIEDIEGTVRGEWAATLAARGRGIEHLCAALRAVGRRDEGEVAVKLRSACRLMPELSQRYGLTTYRVRAYLPRASEWSERLYAYATLAECWPDRRADAAIALRCAALGVAARKLQPRTAFRMLMRWPLLSTPGFLARNLRPLLRSLRLHLNRHRHPTVERVSRSAERELEFRGGA